MLSEEFDDKIRQAADHHHPAYDEQAWTKMEKLLDKHLPQEEDKKRRFIFFLLFFLFLGGGSWLLISQQWKNGEKSNTSTHEMVADKTGKKPAEKNISVNKEEVPVNTEAIVPVTKESQSSADVKLNKPVTDHPVFRIQKQKNSNTFLASNTEKKKNIKSLSLVDKKNELHQDASNPHWLNNEKAEAGKVNKPAAFVQVPATANNDKQGSTTNPAPVVNEKSGAEKNDNDKKVIAEPVPEENKSLASQPVEKKAKTKNKKPNSFLFSLSAGPDLSFVSSNKAGTTKLIIGGGVGFTLHNKVTFRTGFYTGRKIYTASPGSYNPPASWWYYYPNLEKVEADCKVYEIPVLLSYNFGHSNKQSWFVSAGLSSLLMKKETYNYYYKYTPTGPTISKKWTIDNQNKHYFSILTLSAGYQRKIGNHISLIAEPYLKLPLTGVGYGKVKLNSGGILFTIGVNPFNKPGTPVKNFH